MSRPSSPSPPRWPWQRPRHIAEAQTVDPAASELVFVTRQMGVPVEGRFQRWSAQVALDPRKPEAGQVALRIQMDSVAFARARGRPPRRSARCGSTRRASRSAEFRSSGIRAAGGGRYEMAGRLTLKGESHDMVVPVTLTQTAPGHRQRQLRGQAQRLSHRRGRVDRRQPGGARGAGAFSHRAVGFADIVSAKTPWRSKRCVAVVCRLVQSASRCVPSPAQRRPNPRVYQFDPHPHLRQLRAAALRHLDHPRPLRSARRRGHALPRARKAACRCRSTPRSVSTGVAVLDARLKEARHARVQLHPRAYLVAERVEFDADGRVKSLRGESRCAASACR